MSSSRDGFKSGELNSGAGVAALMLTQQLFRHLVYTGLMDKALALELIDQAARQAENMQIQDKTEAKALWQSARFHIEATHIAMRKFPTPDQA